MFKSIEQKTCINLIVGSLGAGKTTLIKQLLAQKSSSENWAILVNEFGAIGIDGAILEEPDNQMQTSLQIKQIPGGCICCTALSGFQDAVEEVMQHIKPDRILIEPTGIGEPESMVDLLNSPYFKEHFNIQTTFAVLDSKITKVEHFKQLMIMQNLVDVADVVVFNKIDTTDSQQLTNLNNFANNLYPPKVAIVNTNRGEVDIALISKVSATNHSFSLSLNNSDVHAHTSTSNHQHNITTKTPALVNQLLNDKANSALYGLLDRKVQHQLGTLSIGWVFTNNIEFNWKKLLSLFQKLSSTQFSSESVLRAKGVFKVGEPSMLFQWVKEQEISREFIAYKRDSRLEVLIPENCDFNITKFEKILASCIT